MARNKAAPPTIFQGTAREIAVRIAKLEGRLMPKPHAARSRRSAARAAILMAGSILCLAACAAVPQGTGGPSSGARSNAQGTWDAPGDLWGG